MMRRLFQCLVFAGCMTPMLFAPGAVAQTPGSARAALTPMLLDVDWNQVWLQLYEEAIRLGFTPAQANEIVKEAQRQDGFPPVGCTSSPENSTVLLGLLASAGLLGGYWRRRAKASVGVGERVPLSGAEAQA